MKEKFPKLPRHFYDPKFIGGVPRPNDWMENPYIGEDGKSYHTLEAFRQANQDYFRRMNSVPVNKYKLY